MLALDLLNFPRFNLLCLPGVTTANFDAVTTALAYGAPSLLEMVTAFGENERVRDNAGSSASTFVSALV